MNGDSIDTMIDPKPESVKPMDPIEIKVEEGIKEYRSGWECCREPVKYSTGAKGWGSE